MLAECSITIRLVCKSLNVLQDLQAKLVVKDGQLGVVTDELDTTRSTMQTVRQEAKTSRDLATKQAQISLGLKQAAAARSLQADQQATALRATINQQVRLVAIVRQASVKAKQAYVSALKQLYIRFQLMVRFLIN